MLRRTCRRPICREVICPLVRELAADGVPVAVTCRVWKIARQPHYRWLKRLVTDGLVRRPRGQAPFAMRGAIVPTRRGVR